MFARQGLLCIRSQGRLDAETAYLQLLALITDDDVDEKVDEV